jgi:hypothetical protein
MQQLINSTNEDAPFNRVLSPQQAEYLCKYFKLKKHGYPESNIGSDREKRRSEQQMP